MPLTRAASKQGLEIVDIARDKKGYDKCAKSWYDAASISKSTLEKFWRREPIRHDNFVAICQAVGVDWETVVNDSGGEDGGNTNKNLDKFHGLKIAKQIHDWLKAVEYNLEEGSEVFTNSYGEWVIKIQDPIRRARFNRILIRGIDSEAKWIDFQNFKTSVEEKNADGGWLIVNLRIIPAVLGELEKSENSHLSCITLDELIDRDADFEPYLEWLAAEVQRRGIDRKYVSLGCIKEEIDPKTQHSIATSNYGEAEGWIEGYIRQWLADDSKEHVSILGEFGTGKTWFAFHYAWECLQAYKHAKEQGLERPRLPLLITLRDYNKALRVESVLSDLFFNKHDIRLNSSVFDCLNQMGKLLLIFDGFDEMADKVDKQKMINNFWELARVVVPGSKVILTSRTEHFPHDRESRQLLNAELESSTARLKWEAPRFELLELAKFNDDQIRQVLTLEAADKELNSEIVDRVMNDAELLDLARRPVMTELIIEAMPEIEAGKPIDMTRIYFYAITRKMSRDITAERTFTSMADKVYFLCELAWEMLSTERMKLNYRDFDKPIKRIFPQLVEESKDLDHWEYDMRGQTILIRNADGDYTPAHRSFLEFLVAYKFAAELGLLKADFLFQEPEGKKLDYIDETAAPKLYTWNGYLQEYVAAKCEGRKIAPLHGFKPESYDYLRDTFGREPLTKAVIDLILPMLVLPNQVDGVGNPLLSAIHFTKGKTETETGWLGGNAATLLVKQNLAALDCEDLSYTQMANSDLVGANLQRVNFNGTNLTNSIFASFLPSEVKAIAFSQDGKFFVTGHEDSNVRLWDAVTRQLLHSYTGHQRAVNGVAISPDGKWLVSGSGDNKLKRWDIQTGKCIHTYMGHRYSVNGVAISPDGKWVVSASSDNTLKRWDTQTGECLHTYVGHQDSVIAVAISVDGKWFISGSNNSTLKRWDVDGQMLDTYSGHQDPVWAVAIAPNGRWFIGGINNSTLKRWDVDGQMLDTYSGHQDPVWVVAIAPNGQWFVSGSMDSALKCWDVETKKCIHTYTGHQRYVTAVAIAPNGEYLVSGSGDRTLKYWDTQTGECIHTSTEYQEGSVLCVAIAPDGKWLASSSRNNVIKRWDTETGKCIQIYVGHRSRIWGVVISPDGKSLLSGSSDNIIKRWDIETGECLHTYVGHRNSVWALAISSDGKWLVSGSSDHTLKRWDTQTGECLRTYLGHRGSIHAVAISLDGKWLVSSSRDDTIKRWDTQTGECLHTYTASAWTVAISPDGKWFISGNNNNTLQRWDTQTGACLNTYNGHRGVVATVAISPDGTWLVSGSGGGSIKRWDTQTGKCIHTYTENQNSVNAVTISSDGCHIISCGEEDEIKIWDVRTGRCIRTISNKPCGGMQIAGAKGLTSGQIESLIALGAVNE